MHKIVQKIEKFFNPNSFSKKLNLTVLIIKSLLNIIDGDIIKISKISFKLGDRFLLSSKMPTKKIKLQVKKNKKSLFSLSKKKLTISLSLK
jgi:hypothetical protein